jgi:hypothetical protein
MRRVFGFAIDEDQIEPGSLAWRTMKQFGQILDTPGRREPDGTSAPNPIQHAGHA